MSSVWQKIKTASGSGTQQTVTFVSQVLNRRNYKDLDKDTDDEVFSNERQSETLEDASVTDNDDDLDAGIGQRRKYLLIINDEPATTTIPTMLENSVDSEHSQDVIKCENSQNEIKELSSKFDVIHQPVVPDITAHVKTDSCELTVNKEILSRKTDNVRRRRDSYDKALSEMRESYDRVFTEIVDYSENTPAVLAVDVPQDTINVDRIHPVEFTQNNTGNESNVFSGTVASNQDQSSQKPPLHRQISSVLQKDIPSALQVIRNRNYSKLDDEIIEIGDTPMSKDISNTEWQESFQADAKTQSKGRKRSKKVWKKTKKAARVAFKWIRRSIVTFGSSYNYGVPITVAMYGGSNRNRRRRGYDYR